MFAITTRTARISDWGRELRREDLFRKRRGRYF